MKTIHTVMLISSLLAITPPVVACVQAVPVVGPAVDAGKCILTDVLAGKSLAEIAADCATDVLTVITTILNSSDPNVLASKAHTEALQIKASFANGPVTGSGK